MRDFLAALTGDKRLNRWAVLILIVGFAILGVGVHFLHAYQVRGNARWLAEEAEQVELGGDLSQASQYLEQYLGLEPGDTDALEKYGLLLNRLAKNDRARVRPFLVLEQVLRREEHRFEARREVARLAVRLRRFSDAKLHLDHLLKAAPEPDAELLHLYARCEASLHQHDSAAKWYRKTLKKAPGQTEVALEYAALLRMGLKLPDMADEVIEELVTANRRSAAVRLEAARYFRRFGQPEAAWKQVRFALDELGPPSADLLVLAAGVALDRGQTDQARTLLEQARREYPRDTRVSRELAGLELRKGERTKALAYLSESLRELPQQPEELWGLANQLIDGNFVEEARALMAHLNKNGPATLVPLLEARLLMREGSWGAASKILEKAQGDRRTALVLVRHAHLLQAQCQERLSNPDQVLATYQRATETDPHWLPARFGLAAALGTAGKFDAAVSEYRKLLAYAPDLRLKLGRILLARTLRQPASQRDWSEVRKLIADMPAEKQDEAAFRLFQAQVHLAQGQEDEARRLVEAERDRDVKQVGPWLFLAGLAARQGKGETLPPLLDEAERRAGKKVEWVLVRARHALRDGSDEARKQLPKLQERLAEFKGPERDQLLAGLAEVFTAAGDEATARRLRSEFADHNADNLPVRFMLVEAALRAKELEEVRRLLSQMRGIEGGEGAYTACAEGALRVLLAEGGDVQARAEARPFLARAAGLRPSWSRVPLLEAALFELERQKEKALEKYQAALERGEGRLGVVRRTLVLLNEQQRFAEAQALLHTLPEQALGTPEMGRLAAEMTLFSPLGEGQDLEAGRKRALELARKAVAADSKDHREYLWLGQVTAAAGQQEEAEKAFRRACALNADAPETCTALIFFLARTDPKKAEAELAQVQPRLKEKSPLALAACYEALGKQELAEEQYKAALAVKPADPVILRQVAAYYTRLGQPATAEAHLRKLLDPAAKVPEATVTWARRSLALSLAAQGDYAHFRAAQAVLEEDRSKNGDTPENRRVQAVVLAMHPAHRREAIRQCESLAASARAIPEELRLMLAKLYEADGNWRAAEVHLLALVQAQERNAGYLRLYIRGLLRQKRPDQAQLSLVKLTEVAPKALETLELQVAVGKALKKDEEAADLVRAYAKQADSRPEVAAAWMEQLGQVKEAEALWGKYVERSKEPKAVLALIHFLDGQNRLGEALALLEKAWTTCPPEAVGPTCVAVVRSPKATAEQRKQVEKWLQTALRKHAQSASLSLSLGELYESQGRYAEAAATYREVLRHKKDNVVALNNLAYLLARKEGKAEEALGLIERAVSAAGPVDELLDTRATVYLCKVQGDLAAQDLEQAIAQRPTADRLFHLALAEIQRGRRSAAREAYRRAKTLGLSEELLHPLERHAYREVTTQMK